MKLVTFRSVGGVDCHYARVNQAYGDLALCTKNRVRKLEPSFLRTMDTCFAELKWLTTGLGPLTSLTSGGAYVDKPGEHRKGKAYDLGGLFWGGSTPLVLTCLEMADAYHNTGRLPVTYPLYIAVEAVLRRHFGTVLGIHHNPDHYNHWHLDTGTPVGLWFSGFGATTRVRFLQEALTYVWMLDVGKPDGKIGKKTRGGIAIMRDQFNLDPIVGLGRAEVWRHLLLLTAMEAVRGWTT